MSSPKEEEDLLPDLTDDLIEFLFVAYPADELIQHVVSGNDREALRYASKLELIRELKALREEQKDASRRD